MRWTKLGALVLFTTTAWLPGASLADPPSRDAGASDADMSLPEATAHVARPWHVPTRTLRRAVVVVERRRVCLAAAGLAAIVDDAARDVVTRALAALALGELACRFERGRTLDGLSATARLSLETATLAGGPAGLRQAATRALGRARSVASTPVLTALRDGDADAVVRFLAAQALTRATDVDQFDTPLRDALVTQYISGASTYELVEETP